MNIKKILILSLCCLTLSACGRDDNKSTRIGNTNICIPNEFMVNLGNSSNNSYDSAPEVYKSVSIDPDYIKKEIPGYKEKIGEKPYQRHSYLHITLTQYQPYRGEIPKPSKYDHFFTSNSPNLVGYRNEWPYVSWTSFEIQPDKKRVYWGECTDYSNEKRRKPVECNRSLEMQSIDFLYSISGSNIDLYPDIDTYLKNKVSNEWRCE